MRHVIISDSAPAPEIPDQVRVIERDTGDLESLLPAVLEGEIAIAVWRDTLELVRQTRHLQALYRDKLDRAVRRAMEDLEELLDARVGLLAAGLAAFDARRDQPVEGGGL